MSDQNPGSPDDSNGRREGPEGLDAQDSLNAQLEKAKSQYLYLAAEFENFKRQKIKESSDARKYGAERLAVDLLNVLDIFETALATELTSANMDSFRKGIEMTAVELRAALSRHGVEELPAVGQPFDPSCHEALTSEETIAVPAGHVARVFKKPYRLHDRVIRPGQVVVAKAPHQN
jgi:molecular chaperone GrpE